MATQTEQKPLKKRSVVSSFIYKTEHKPGETKTQVALFRRSGKVSTYRHHLAPISGSIDQADPSPLAAAWREIHEETTLDSSSLELTRQGKSYVFSDPSVGREWTIYPFAFRLRSTDEGGQGEAGIVTDWEHEGWGWYDPMEVEDSDDFGGVPRLAESLRQVWFEKDLGAEAGSVLAAGLEILKNDHESGARQLAGVALEILRDVVAKVDSLEPSEEWWARVRSAAWHIWKNGRESMGAAIMSVLLSALQRTEGVLKQYRGHPGSKQSAGWRDAVLEDLQRSVSSRTTDSARILSEAFVKHLEDNFAPRPESKLAIKILTLSESSSITASLNHAIACTGFNFDIRILESRPLFEGVSLAGSILGSISRDITSAPASHPHTHQEEERDDGSREPPPQKVKLTLYTDASAALASQGVDVVLIGADRIASSGAVSNKTGSLPAVLSARHISPRANIVVVAESEKVAPPGNPADHVVENNSPRPLLRSWQASFNSGRVRAAAGTLSKLTAGGVGGSRGQAGTASKPDQERQEEQAQQPEEEGIRSVAATAVEVRNVFFEWVPPELVDVYVTEYGIWTVEDIARHSETLAAEADRLFGDI